ncbi:histone acetylation protein-domain-containing protein [Xylariaceae sp. FL0804]|nr:histone acetylation protein-domain-containing protein [Xylariaceae sp. FL0804]
MMATKPSGPGIARPLARSHPLAQELARALPRDCQFTAFHLSTTPTLAEALCYPPALKDAVEPGAIPTGEARERERRPSKALKTYCEKQFLAISVKSEQEEAGSDKDVLVLGLEVYIFTTAFSTIIFVSKADSTGYLHLLKAPEGISPIRETTTAFLGFLIATRKRHSKQLVVNLFARSQSQYLFPGSVKNSGKHVLDDRGLIKWWCRVLNPLLEGECGSSEARERWARIHGYLVIPGLDKYETRAFVPRTSAASRNWTLDHPLERISPYTKDPSAFGSDIPPRCLIPTYPDDPKARYVEELEESTSEKIKLSRGWKSPTTLEQFWEMMAFRQECSSGRMTGFIWIVFDPEETPHSAIEQGNRATDTTAALPTPNGSFSACASESIIPATSGSSQRSIAELVTPSSTPSKPTKASDNPRRKRRKLTGVIIPREPRIKTRRHTQRPRHSVTRHYYWPQAGRGQVVLNDNDYKRAVELLLHLEFGTLPQALASTARWVNEVNLGEDWALPIVGQRDVPIKATPSAVGTVNNLSATIKRKRPADDQARDMPKVASAVNMLGGGLVRKKAKVEASGDPSASSA